MSIYKQFETNPKAEKEGVPFTFAANDDKTIPTFICARMGGANSKWREEYAEIWKPYRDQQEAGTVPEDVVKSNSVLVFVRASLRGWSNVQDRDGNTISFNEQNAVKLFTDLPELLAELQSLVIGRERFLKYQEKVASKN